MFELNDRARLQALHQAALAAGAQAIDTDVMISTASAAIRQQRFDNALAILTAALVLDPEHPRGWALAGIVLEKLGREPDARSAYESALGLDEQDFVTALALATLYARADEGDRALALLNWLLAEIEDAPDIRSRASALKRALEQEETP